MRRIRSKHTKPELIIRSLLHRSGFRFRLNDKNLPGSPDIVLSKYNTVIFVHGCFWHRHTNCSKATMPSTNTDYWQKKFDRNITRDIEIKVALQNLEWNVIVLWECDIMNDPISVLELVIKKLGYKEYKNPIHGIGRKQILKIAEEKSQYFLKNRSKINEKK